MQVVIDYLKANQERFVTELKEYLRFASVSAQSQHKPDLAACADWLVNHCRHQLAQTALAQERYEEAVHHEREALRIAVDSGLRGMIAENLTAFAGALAAWPGPGETGRLRQAARAYGSAHGLLQHSLVFAPGTAALGAEVLPGAEILPGAGELRARLGSADFTEAWQAGEHTPAEAFLEMDGTG